MWGKEKSEKDENRGFINFAEIGWNMQYAALA